MNDKRENGPKSYPSPRPTPDKAKESAASTWKPSFNPWLVGVVVTLAAFTEIIDTTIVNVAL